VSRHTAWEEIGSAWVPIAPGVRFLLKPVTGDVVALVQSRVAKMMADIVNSRADLSALGFEDAALGVLGDLDMVAGVSVFAAAVFYGEALIEDWDGIVDPTTGEKIDVTEFAEPELRALAIRSAMRFGTPEGRLALMPPFMAWVDAPRMPTAADQRRLREGAKWDFSAMGAEHCKGCAVTNARCARLGDDGGALCPRVANAPQTAPGIAALEISRLAGVWRTGGMGGLVGLDYAAALALYTGPDEAGLVRCLAAIEAGALEAAAERAAQA
jgi:hypothetical protein